LEKKEQRRKEQRKIGIGKLDKIQEKKGIRVFSFFFKKKKIN